MNDEIKLTWSERRAVKRLRSLMESWPDELRVIINAAEVKVHKRTAPFMAVEVDRYPNPSHGKPD